MSSVHSRGKKKAKCGFPVMPGPHQVKWRLLTGGPRCPCCHPMGPLGQPPAGLSVEGRQSFPAWRVRSGPVPLDPAPCGPWLALC